MILALSATKIALKGKKGLIVGIANRLPGGAPSRLINRCPVSTPRKTLRLRALINGPADQGQRVAAGREV